MASEQLIQQLLDEHAKAVAIVWSAEHEAVIADLDAALAALGEPPAPLVPQWQPIETAPKDGTPILGCKPSWTHPYVFAYLNGPDLSEGWHDFNISPTGRRPHTLTHWMPLPDPPAGSVGDATPELAEGQKCPCGAEMKFAPGIGPFCSRTGIDAPCATPRETEQ